jgi:hypothetical protein
VDGDAAEGLGDGFGDGEGGAEGACWDSYEDFAGLFFLGGEGVSICYMLYVILIDLNLPRDVIIIIIIIIIGMWIVDREERQYETRDKPRVSP